jgi:hypothetical protein
MRMMLKEEDESEGADSVVLRAGYFDRLRALLAGRIAHAASEFGVFFSAGIEEEGERGIT